MSAFRSMFSSNSRSISRASPRRHPSIPIALLISHRIPIGICGRSSPMSVCISAPPSKSISAISFAGRRPSSSLIAFLMRCWALGPACWRLPSACCRVPSRLSKIRKAIFRVVLSCSFLMVHFHHIRPSIKRANKKVLGELNSSKQLKTSTTATSFKIMPKRRSIQAVAFSIRYSNRLPKT